MEKEKLLQPEPHCLTLLNFGGGSTELGSLVCPVKLHEECGNY